MLLVPTELRPSRIQGIGLFLLVPVKKGELVWRFDPRIDRIYSDSEADGMPALYLDFLNTYATWHEATGFYMLYGDPNMKYANHSETPNLLATASSFGDMTANSDLDSDTELTYDYWVMCDGVRLTGRYRG